MKFKMALIIAAVSTSALAETTVSEKEYNLPKCSKPIASVMVGNISCKSAACQQGAADAGAGPVAHWQLGCIRAARADSAGHGVYEAQPPGAGGSEF